MPSASRISTRPVKAEVERPVVVEEGCGNVFADLGIANPELALQKAKLVQRIRGAITEKKLTQVRAAKLLKLEPVKLADLLRGQTQRYTLDRLFKLLYALGQDVEIVVRPATK